VAVGGVFAGIRSACVARGELDRSTALVRVLDSLRGFQRLAAFGGRALKRLEPRLGDEIGMRRDGPLREGYFLGGFGALFADEGHAHRSLLQTD